MESGPMKRPANATHRDTPPVDVVSSWQVSWLAGRRLHSSSRNARSSDTGEYRLAAYSCGGSAGLVLIKDAPASLLAPHAESA